MYSFDGRYSFQTLIWNQPNFFEVCASNTFASEYVSASIKNRLEKYAILIQTLEGYDCLFITDERLVS